MFGVFVAISSRSDIATQAHRSCQGLLGLFLLDVVYGMYNFCLISASFLLGLVIKQAQESLAAAMSLSDIITS